MISELNKADNNFGVLNISKRPSRRSLLTSYMTKSSPRLFLLKNSGILKSCVLGCAG
jgi:hypothetical protein